MKELWTWTHQLIDYLAHIFFDPNCKHWKNMWSSNDLEVTLRTKKPIKFWQFLTLSASISCKYLFQLLNDFTKSLCMTSRYLSKREWLWLVNIWGCGLCQLIFSIFGYHFIYLGCRLKAHIYMNSSQRVDMIKKKDHPNLLIISWEKFYFLFGQTGNCG